MKRAAGLDCQLPKLFCHYFQDERTADLPLNEGDLVALLTQFPFDELFKNVLVLPELGEYGVSELREESTNHP